MRKLLFTLILTSLSALLSAQSTDSAFVNIVLTDTDSIAEAGAQVKIYSKDKRFVLEGTTNDFGILKTQLPQEVQLSFDIYRFDTIFNFQQVIPKGDYGNYQIPFHLQISYVKNVVRTYNMPVFFESGSHEVNNESKLNIDKLLKELEKNSKMSVEVGAHTDNVESDKYNQDLSQRRASAIRNYLVSKGIAGNRILAKGYGETKPVGDNNTELGKAQNRRVEITVISE